MYGLVFAGGGAKGAYQIGVWRALDEMGLDIRLVVGTSVGALNGALYAQQDYEVAKHFWTHMNMETVFKAEPDILKGLKDTFKGRIFQNNITFYKELTSYIKQNKGFDITPLRETVYNVLDEDKIRSSHIDYGFITYNLDKRVPMKLFKEDIKYDDMKYYVLGSATVPGFAGDKEFPTRLADGGIHDRFPINMAINRGYKNIIAVETRQRKIKKVNGINIISIVPSENTGNFLIFDKEQSLKNFEMGYLDCLRVFHKLEGLEYYFLNVPTDNQIMKNIIKLKSTKLSMFFKENTKPEKITLKRLLEIEFPKMFRKLPIKRKETYSETALALLEYLMKINTYDRLKKYDFYDAIDMCDQPYLEGSEDKEIIEFLKLIFK